MSTSKIEWTQDTWNPIIGCDKVSAGCKNCYAMRMAWRLQHNPKMKDKYAGTAMKTAGGDINWTGKINFDNTALSIPLRTRKPTTFFVNSMSDLFHESVPFEFIDKLFVVMFYAQVHKHTFQILTKRPERMLQYFEGGLEVVGKRWADAIPAIFPKERPEWIESDEELYSMNKGLFMASLRGNTPARIKRWPLENVWLGVSVEDQKAADERIPLLLQVPAAVRFLSCEPLLGPVDLSQVQLKMLVDKHNYSDDSDIDWVIVGGESGPGARPMHPDWARSLRDQCAAADVPFFFKQWGEFLPRCQSNCNTPGITKRSTVTFPSPHNPDKENTYYKIGKKAAGRLLDGVEHNGMPAVKEAVVS